MTAEGNAEQIRADIVGFVSSVSTFWDAKPDENQYIIEQVTKQVQTADAYRRDILQGPTGSELIHVFEKGGVQVRKRVFHPGRGEHLTGADFVLSKRPEKGETGAIAVQVKRNRGKEFFEFRGRDIRQFRRLANFSGEAYYLMIDETKNPPTECLMPLQAIGHELHLRPGGPLPQQIRIFIPNEIVRQFCQDPEDLYREFYACRKGLREPENLFINRVSEYVRRVKRVVVELFVSPKGPDE